MSKEIMQQALTVLKEWDALIKYQYNGSGEAMTAMQIVAWRTLDTIKTLEAEYDKLKEKNEYLNKKIKELINQKITAIKNKIQEEKI